MSFARKLLFASCILTLLTPALLAQTGNGSAATIATVNGQKLTFADLDRQENNKLLQSRYTYYEAQRKALDDLIDQQLLEQQARKENIAVDQLIDREVKSKLPADPTEEQLRVTYEVLDTDQPFDAIRGKLLDHIRETRLSKGKAAYVKQLRSQATIAIALEPPHANVEVANAMIKGSPNAQVVLVEFADYQCPYCQKIHPELDKLKQEFGDKLSIVYKDYPLPMHPHAEKAAEAARCAGAQGKFWEFHDMLFTEKKLEISDLKQEARTLKLDGTKFDKCLDNGEQAAAVQSDLAEGKKLGLNATPSFFVNGHYFSGAVSYATLRDMVHQQLTTSLSSTKETSPTESSLR